VLDAVCPVGGGDYSVTASRMGLVPSDGKMVGVTGTASLFGVVASVVRLRCREVRMVALHTSRLSCDCPHAGSRNSATVKDSTHPDRPL